MKKRSALIVILSILFLTFAAVRSTAFAQQVTVNSNTPGGGQTVTITDPYGGTYSAYLHLPSDYNTSTKTYPLLIFLHGMGEAGTDLSMIYNNGYAGGPAYLAEHGLLGKYTSPTTGQQSEFIVLAPQATWFSTTGANLNKILMAFVPRYRVDTTRIYPTGLSAGGQGVTEFMVHSGWTNQYTAAAAIPMSEAWYYPAGSANVIVNDKVYNWGFGSDPEDQFGVLTHQLMNQINAVSPGMARYTNYSGGHCCWNAFYDPAYKETVNGKSMNIYEWLLQYARGTAAPTPSNYPPTANAGTNQTIALPASTVTLSGSGTDSDGTIASYAWSKISGGSATITTPAAATTTVTGLTAGTYTFRLTVTDNKGATGTADVTVTVNAAPVPTAGPYGGTAWAIPGTVQAEDFDYGGEGAAYHDLDAPNQGGQYRTSDGVDIEKSTDGGYNIGWINSGEWMKYSVAVAATGTYTLQARIADPYGGSMQVEMDGAVVATITLPVTGGYQTWQTATVPNVALTQGSHTMRVVATGNGFNINYLTFASATAPANNPPIANAGANQTITLPTNTVTLTGSGTDTDGTIASYAWTKVSGTGGTISSPSSVSTAVTGLTAGTYTFKLTVTDNQGATGSANVTVTVNAAPVVNVPPTASAGSAQTITLPTNSVTLSGSGSDSDGTIASYAWSKVTGGSATITSPASASTSVTGLSQGTYTFRLTVTDNSGATASADVSVTVLAAPVTPPTTSQAATYYIDFGLSTAKTTNTGWNNVISPATGTSISLVDSTGAATSGRLQITDSFYYNSGNATDSSINQNGTTASSLYPSTATMDSFFLGKLNGLTDDSAVVTVSGLNNTSTYDFRFYASRTSGDHSNRTTDYTIAGKTATLDATNNTNTYADITGIASSNGSVTISVARDSAATYGYLGVLQITEHPATTTPAPTPTNTPPTASAGVNQTITLPTNSVTLSGSGSDSDGTIASYAWSVVSGPATPTIVSASSASTDVSGLSVAGTYIFRLTVTDNAGAKATADVTVTVASAPIATPPPASTSAYGGVAWAIPGTIQAEDFDVGGEGVAYHDTDANNNGGAYRKNEGVDMEAAWGDNTGGGYLVGWSAAGEWQKYTVNVQTNGTYTLDARVASPNSGMTTQIEVDGTPLTSISIPNTGAWQSWQTVTVPNLSLTQGVHVLRIYTPTGGYNLNYLKFSQVLGAYSADPASVVYVTAKNTLNVRSAPKTGKVIGKVPHDMLGTILIDSATWPKVTFQNGITGYVSRAYIDLQIKHK